MQLTVNVNVGVNLIRTINVNIEREVSSGGFVWSLAESGSVYVCAIVRMKAVVEIKSQLISDKY